MIRKYPGLEYRLTLQFLTAIFIVQITAGFIWGLDPEKPAGQYSVDSWQTSEGLPSNTIISITQTPDGYLWLATSKGLVRFDGIKFKIVPYIDKTGPETLEETTPYTLLVDKTGTLWIGGSPAGLTAYHYKTGKIQTFSDADGLTRDRIRRITIDMNGNLWLGFWASYVNRFSNGTFITFDHRHGLLGKKINAIIEDRNGNLLFGSREKGIFKYKGGTFTPYPVQGLENRQLIAMYEDRKGDIWIGTNEGLFRKSFDRATRYTVANGLSHNYITAVVEDGDQNLWVASLDGLNRMTRENGGSVTVDSILKSFKVICLFEDKEKSLWAGTYTHGLKRVKNGKFSSFTPLDVFHDDAPISLCRDRGGIVWVGTFTGKFLRFKNGAFKDSIQPPQLARTGISAIGQDLKGYIWLGTNGKGVFRISNPGAAPGRISLEQYTIRQGLADNQISSIAPDSRGNMWVSTADGVSLIETDTGMIRSLTSNGGLSGKVANNTYEDKNRNIWIAADKGITVLKAGDFEKKDLTVYLKGNTVTRIYPDPTPGPDQIYWAATHGAGLKRLKIDSRENVSVTSFDTSNGLPTNFLYQFHEDNHGRFWIMSKNGILRLNKAELNRFANGEQTRFNCISYGVSDGLNSSEFDNEYSRHSTLRTPNNELWFITKMGVSIVNPGTIRIDKQPPPVVIEKLTVGRRSVAPRKENAAKFTFKGSHSLSVHFTAPSYLSPQNIKFKYRLQGHDDRYRYLTPGKERAVHYPALEPGTYTFTVTAANAEGIWNETGESVTLTFLPYFHQTLWFKAILAFLGTAFIAGFYFVYKNIHKKISRARALEQEPVQKEKYKDSKLNPVFVEEIIKRLKHQVEVEKIYREPELTLQALAQALSIQPHQLSQVINDRLKRSFPDFINYHRIEEARWILENPGTREIKITAMAMDVGFNTMPAFYNAFKKYTGITPSQYKKEIERRKKT